MATRSKMRIGVIGTGVLGGAIGRCLLEARYSLVVHDRRREAAEEVCALGAAWASSPRAVAEISQVVMTAVPGPQELEELFFSPEHGLLPAMTPGQGYIDVSTSSPDLARRIAAACQSRSVDFIDAPMSGLPPDATIMIGGDAAAVARYHRLFDALGEHVVHVGETGAGCVSKLVSQYLACANFIAAVEGLLIAAKAGVDLGLVGKTIPCTAGASRFFHLLPSSVFDGTFQSRGTLDILTKDMDLACQLADEFGVPPRIGMIVREVLGSAQARGWGQRGFPVAARVLEEIAGVELRAPRQDPES